MTTICVECEHSICRGAASSRMYCVAPWPKTIDKVSGRMVPCVVKCKKMNDGNCEHFVQRLTFGQWLRTFLGLRNEPWPPIGRP